MQDPGSTLYLEINNLNFIFFVIKSDENNFKITYKLDVPINGIEEDRILDLEKYFIIIKENIYLIEQKLNYTFKEIVLIVDNFNPTFINLTGFKKLNGSQVLKENITYILNTLKSCVDETEHKKTILHIFNSKHYLDDKKIENLPIGLFGDLYSHELSFTLINSNDYKNLNYIFEKCNLKIKKVLIKSFVKGANISENLNNTGTFFQITISQDNSKVIYFENNSLKFSQEFNFGISIIIKDISKITALKKETVKKILEKIEFKNEELDNELLEKEFFENNEYRKIKKKLIYDIALARIKEIFELLIFKNVNFKFYIKNSKVIFLEIDSAVNPKGLREIFKAIFSSNNSFEVNFLNNLSFNSFSKTVNKLVHYGWKKEAIPVSKSKKSIIAKFFDAIFG